MLLLVLNVLYFYVSTLVLIIIIIVFVWGIEFGAGEIMKIYTKYLCIDKPFRNKACGKGKPVIKKKW